MRTNNSHECCNIRHKDTCNDWLCFTTGSIGFNFGADRNGYGRDVHGVEMRTDSTRHCPSSTACLNLCTIATSQLQTNEYATNVVSKKTRQHHRKDNNPKLYFKINLCFLATVFYQSSFLAATHVYGVWCYMAQRPGQPPPRPWTAWEEMTVPWSDGSVV